MMLYSIIQIEDQALKDRLAVTCDNQPFIARAPLLLLFAADYQRQFDMYTMSSAEEKSRERGVEYRTPREGDMLLACCDALIAAQTAVIAAQSLGIGSCYIGDILEHYEVHRDLLALPPYVVPIAMVCFGRPAVEKEDVRLTPRYDPEFIVFKNAYHRLSRGEMEEMLRPAVERAFPAEYRVEDTDEIARRIYFRKFASDFAVEMNRSAGEMIKNWKSKEA